MSVTKFNIFKKFSFLTDQYIFNTFISWMLFSAIDGAIDIFTRYLKPIVTKSLFLQVGLHRKVPAINSLGRNDFE